MTCFKLFPVCFTIVLLFRTICAYPTSIVLDISDNQTTICSAKRCIPKCCEKGYHLNYINETYVCNEGVKEYESYNVTVYDEYHYDERSDKSLRDIFLLVPGRMYDTIGADNSTFEDNYPFDAEEQGLKQYLIETGSLYIELPNAYERWIPVKYWCIDYLADAEMTEAEPKLLIAFLSEDNSVAPVRHYYFYYLLMSSLFLVMVLLVYIILPELRNLGGMILMAYVTSLLFGFILLGTVQRAEINTSDCIKITASIYFFLLATFCWMNVMSVDIWWTFRGYAKARPIHRRGELFKFCMYCLYAWGLPAAMTIFFVIMNESDLSHLPWIIKPMIPKSGCFLQDGQKLVYLYIPMLILILCNWLFFLMTAYNIKRLMSGTAVLNSAAAGNAAAHQQQRNRLVVYLKLSVIMGINWVLEVVSSFTPNFRLWELFDTYNLLMGFAIFLIFVCKKKIYKKLVARYYELRKRFCGVRRPARTLTKSSTSSSTLESNLSQDIPLQVSSNPMPEEKRERGKCTIYSFGKKNCK